MEDEKNGIRKPPQVAMNRGPGAGIAPGEKPKDLGTAIWKLIKYMGSAKYAVRSVDYDGQTSDWVE